MRVETAPGRVVCSLTGVQGPGPVCRKDCGYSWHGFPWWAQGMLLQGPQTKETAKRKRDILLICEEPSAVSSQRDMLAPHGDPERAEPEERLFPALLLHTPVSGWQALPVAEALPPLTSWGLAPSKGSGTREENRRKDHLRGGLETWNYTCEWRWDHSSRVLCTSW